MTDRAAPDALSPGAFMTEVSEQATSQPATPERNRAIERAALDASNAASPGAAARLVAVALRDELAAARADFVERLETALRAQRVAEESATEGFRQSRKKDAALFVMTEELERRMLKQREHDQRWQIALRATGERACIINRALRHEIGAHAAASMANVAELTQRVGDLEADKAAAEAKIRELGGEVPVGRASTPPPAASNTDMGAAMETLKQANRDLADRISTLRQEHNAMGDRLDAESRRAEAAVAALRAAEQEIAELRRHKAQGAGGPDTVALSVTTKVAQQIDELGGIGSLLGTLSERTQLLAEINEENRALRDEIVLLEARCVTTETKLHHHVEEGVATSILLERGIGRMKPKSVADADGSETRRTLTQAAMTLRRALEREGYAISSLPLAPDPGLDLPYLRQILSDHADMCAAHFNKSGTGAVVPSATRKPLVYS